MRHRHMTTVDLGSARITIKTTPFLNNESDKNFAEKHDYKVLCFLFNILTETQLIPQKQTRRYYSVQEKMFFEGITTPKVCIKIELSRREWVSVLVLVIFDDFGMIWIPNDQLDCFQQILHISTT